MALRLSPHRSITGFLGDPLRLNEQWALGVFMPRKLRHPSMNSTATHSVRGSVCWPGRVPLDGLRGWMKFAFNNKVVSRREAGLYRQ